MFIINWIKRKIAERKKQKVRTQMINDKIVKLRAELKQKTPQEIEEMAFGDLKRFKKTTH